MITSDSVSNPNVEWRPSAQRIKPKVLSKLTQGNFFSLLLQSASFTTLLTKYHMDSNYSLKESYVSWAHAFIILFLHCSRFYLHPTILQVLSSFLSTTEQFPSLLSKVLSFMTLFIYWVELYLYRCRNPLDFKSTEGGTIYLHELKD